MASPSTLSLTAPGRVRLYSTAELLKLPPPEWLVDGIMPAGGLVGLYGAPGDGKSFLALDIALSVATGRPWHGHPVKRDYVLYIAAEGGTGMGKRARAWLLHYGVEAPDVSMAWMIDSLPVHAESSDLDTLLERLEHEVDRRPGLVIIDTLARCFDGNENQQEDMGRFVNGVDKFRRAYGATTLVIHHTGLASGRERGSTSFRGAAETMMSVDMNQQTQTMTITCDKQKDALRFEPINLTLTDVVEAESAVLTQPGLEAAIARKAELLAILVKGPRTAKQIQAKSHGELSRSTLFRLLRDTVKTGEIIKENDEYRLSVPR
jgi:hypothetical protein